jgi:outer membrane biosynthesis protein TonB
MMRRYTVPAALRDSVWTGLEPRLRRYLRVCTVVGVVLALALAWMPAHKPQPQPRRSLERRAARLLTPKKAPAPRMVQTPTAPTPRPRPQTVAKPPPAAPAPTRQRDKPKAQPTQPRLPRTAQQAPAPKDPSVGQKGREAAQSATRKLAETTAGIDNLLSSVNGMVPAAGGTASGAAAAKPSQNYAMASGRKAQQLESIDGTLQAQGAGSGGGSQGVARTGVDIVDDGVRTLGEAADVWGRDTASLMAVVQRYKAGVKFCYDNALKKTPRLNGKITLQMDIDATGRIASLSVASDTIGNLPLQKCIRAQVQNWRFAKVDAGTVRFTLPLVFSPPD